MSKEYACKVSRPCHFRTQSFFPKEVTQWWWTDMLLPRRLFLAALLKITCCCYVFMACPRDSMANSAAHSAKSWPPITLAWVASARPRDKLGCRRPFRQETRVSHVKSSCDVISRDLFLCDSSLFSVERKNEKLQFPSKPNQTSTLFLPTCEKWVHSKNWLLWTKFVKYFTFGSGCTRAAVKNWTDEIDDGLACSHSCSPRGFHDNAVGVSLDIKIVRTTTTSTTSPAPPPRLSFDVASGSAEQKADTQRVRRNGELSASRLRRRHDHLHGQNHQQQKSDRLHHERKLNDYSLRVPRAWWLNQSLPGAFVGRERFPHAHGKGARIFKLVLNRLSTRLKMPAHQTTIHPIKVTFIDRVPAPLKNHAGGHHKGNVRRWMEVNCFRRISLAAM